MKLYYITLNNTNEVLQIIQIILKEKLAVCVNWFAVTCAYHWEGKLFQEPEIVLIIKTQSNYRKRIEEVISQHIFSKKIIFEFTPNSGNKEFLDWLNKEIPNNSLVESIS